MTSSAQGYHINIRTSRPGICRAKTPASCTVSGGAIHDGDKAFATKQEAKDHIEAMEKKNNSGQSLRGSRSKNDAKAQNISKTSESVSIANEPNYHAESHPMGRGWIPERYSNFPEDEVKFNPDKHMRSEWENMSRTQIASTLSYGRDIDIAPVRLIPVGSQVYVPGKGKAEMLSAKTIESADGSSRTVGRYKLQDGTIGELDADKRIDVHSTPSPRNDKVDSKFFSANARAARLSEERRKFRNDVENFEKTSYNKILSDTANKLNNDQNMSKGEQSAYRSLAHTVKQTSEFPQNENIRGLVRARMEDNLIFAQDASRNSTGEDLAFYSDRIKTLNSIMEQLNRATGFEEKNRPLR